MQEEKFKVIWRRYDNDEEYFIGTLTKKDTWSFKYNLEGVHDAIKNGFRILPEFDDIFIEYEEAKLFSTFKSRIPSQERVDMLKKYNIGSYNQIEILKRTSGITMSDNLEIRHVLKKVA